MQVIQINVRGVEIEAWEALKQVRDETRTATGKLLSDAIHLLADDFFDAEEAASERV